MARLLTSSMKVFAILLTKTSSVSRSQEMPSKQRTRGPSDPESPRGLPPVAADLLVIAGGKG